MKTAAKHTPRVDEKHLESAFGDYLYRRLPPHTGDVKAAVLCPLFIQDGQANLLFIKRSQMVKKHKGEISFPGGVQEKEDGCLANTCIRETEEEIGIRARDIKIIGRLDEVYTTTGYLVSPFLGLIPYPYAFSLCTREVDSLLPVALATLDNPQNQYDFYYYNGRKFYDLVAYRVGREIIWGATAKIVDRLLQLFRSQGLLPVA